MTFALPDDEAAGFTACHRVDGAPDFDQFSVWRRFGGRSIGRATLNRALAWAAPQGPLWLTAYDHPGVPWNRPMYERRGFVGAPEAERGLEMRAVIAGQREALPAPEARVVMCHDPANPHARRIFSSGRPLASSSTSLSR